MDKENKLKDLRERKGLSQEDVYKEMTREGFDRTIKNISKYETGTQEMSLQTATIYANAISASLDEISERLYPKQDYNLLRGLKRKMDSKEKCMQEPFDNKNSHITFEDELSAAKIDKDILAKVDDRRQYYSSNYAPKINTNKVSEVFREYCKEEYEYYKERYNDLNKADADVARAIVMSTTANYNRFTEWLSQLEDTHTKIFDLYLLGQEDLIRERHGEEILAQMKNLKEHPTEIFIELLAFEYAYHITDFISEEKVSHS